MMSNQRSDTPAAVSASRGLNNIDSEVAPGRFLSEQMKSSKSAECTQRSAAITHTRGYKNKLLGSCFVKTSQVTWKSVSEGMRGSFSSFGFPSIGKTRARLKNGLRSVNC